MKTNFADKRTSTVFCLIAMFLWGSLFPTIKIGYRVFSIDTTLPGSVLLFAGVRFFLCGIILVACTFMKKQTRSLPGKEHAAQIIVLALFSYILHYTCTYIGLTHLESTKTSIIKQFGTLFLVCFAFLFQKDDRFGIAKVVSGVLGFVGIIIVNMRGSQIRLDSYDFLVVGASLCTVISTILSKRFYVRLDPFATTAWAQLLGGAVLIVIGLLLGGSFGTINLRALLVLFYICSASCIGYALWNILLKYNSISRLNIMKFSESLFSGLCSWLLLGEDIFSVQYLLAFLLVFCGILLGNGAFPSKKHKNNCAKEKSL